MPRVRSVHSRRQTGRRFSPARWWCAMFSTRDHAFYQHVIMCPGTALSPSRCCLLRRFCLANFSHSQFKLVSTNTMAVNGQCIAMQAAEAQCAQTTECQALTFQADSVPTPSRICVNVAETSATGVSSKSRKMVPIHANFRPFFD